MHAIERFARSQGANAEAALHLAACLTEGQLGQSVSEGLDLTRAAHRVGELISSFAGRVDPDGVPARVSVAMVPQADAKRLSTSDRQWLESLVRRSRNCQEGRITEQAWLRIAIPWVVAVRERLPVEHFGLDQVTLNLVSKFLVMRGVHQARGDAGVPYVASVVIYDLYRPVVLTTTPSPEDAVDPLLAFAEKHRGDTRAAYHLRAMLSGDVTRAFIPPVDGSDMRSAGNALRTTLLAQSMEEDANGSESAISMLLIPDLPRKLSAKDRQWLLELARCSPAVRSGSLTDGEWLGVAGAWVVAVRARRQTAWQLAGPVRLGQSKWARLSRLLASQIRASRATSRRRTTPFLASVLLIPNDE